MHREGKGKTTDVQELITVAFAEDMELAKQYQELLRNNEISARIKRQPEMSQSGFSDIAIQVSEESLDEAHALISEKANYDNFFDMMFDDQDDTPMDCSDLQLDEDADCY